MELKDIWFGEGTDIDENGKIYRYKKAKFKVNGAEHTLKISMVDFENDRALDLIKREAEKIDAVFRGKK